MWQIDTERCIKTKVTIQCIDISLAKELFSYCKIVPLSHLAIHELQLQDLLHIGDFFQRRTAPAIGI